MYYIILDNAVKINKNNYFGVDGKNMYFYIINNNNYYYIILYYKI